MKKKKHSTAAQFQGHDTEIKKKKTNRTDNTAKLWIFSDDIISYFTGFSILYIAVTLQNFSHIFGQYYFYNFRAPLGIHIRFLGEAVTEWSETRTTTDAEGKSHTEKVRYGTTEEYFNRTQYFLGAPNGPTIELPSGTYTYPFSYTLPSTLPSSFEGPEGHIRYTIKATLDPPRRFGDEVKIAFTVISPVDLNLNSRLKVSVFIRNLLVLRI